ncbi:NudC domain-containing protein 1 [Nymphon striatum]|nr:NudC domain-containing protein 1 [Nymphon striatum]
MLAPRDVLKDDAAGDCALEFDLVPDFNPGLASVLVVPPSCVENPVLQEYNEQSFLLTKLTGLFNNLKIDLWTSSSQYSSLYVCNARDEIVCYEFSEECHFMSANVVWKIPNHPLDYRENEDKFPVSLDFPSSKMVVVSDGKGYVYILSTGDRSSNCSNIWKLEYEIRHMDQPFILLESKFSKVDSSLLDCVVLWIAESECVDNCEKYKKKEIHYLSVLDWLTFKKDDIEWSINRKQRLVSPSYPDYVCVNENGTSLLVASSNNYETIFDSVKPVDKAVAVSNEETSNDDVQQHTYIWSQTADEINVIFVDHENLQKPNVKVVLNHDSAMVSIHGNLLLDGKLWKSIELEGSTWSFDDLKRLVLILMKKHTDEHWEQLMEDDDANGKKIDENETSRQKQKAEGVFESGKTAYNPGELEECDVLDYDSYSLQSIGGNSHSCEYRVDISGRKFLFTVKHKKDDNPTICLRHDVDGLLWQPSDKDSKLEFQHISTFNALGFVQASKRDMKFLTCEPNFHFVALACVRRHIYVYKQPSILDSAFEVRNRKSNQRISTVAHQHVITLESNDAILGLIASNDRIFVLTTSMIHTYKL